MNKHTSDSINPVNVAFSTKQDITPRLHSAELFGAVREVVIEHAGEEYRLRLTRQGKLILTK